MCALFRQETVVRATAEALFEILAEKDGLGSIIIMMCSKLLPRKMVWAKLLVLLVLLLVLLLLLLLLFYIYCFMIER